MKEKVIRRWLFGLISLFFIVSLIACGGGGGGSSSGTTQTISGTAAIGKPLANVPIYLKDKNGKTKNTITDLNGKFSFDTTDLTPPFYLKTQGYNLFSYTDKSSGTVNITPLTTAVVAIANDGNPDIYTTPPLKLNLDNAKKSLNSLLSPVLQKYGVQNADFITTPFDANGQGMDAVLDSILISVNSPNKTIEIKNPYTGDTIGVGSFTNGNVNISDPINNDEANGLPKPVKFKKYFAYIKNNYNSPEEGPYMIDLVEGDNGLISVTITATEGDTGDLFLIYGNGTKSGNNISFTVAVIMCSDTNRAGTGTAVFTGTVDSKGNITGTFINTLSEGNRCKENNSNIYEGTWTAEDVTNATPINVAGTYNTYATPTEDEEKGPATLRITQSGSSINVSLTFLDKDTGQTVTRSGQGIVYGNYLMFKIPVIICRNAGTLPAEYATFFGKYNNGTITGVYGDGVPAGDYCKAPDYDQTKRTVKAEGRWRAVKK